MNLVANVFLQTFSQTFSRAIAGLFAVALSAGSVALASASDTEDVAPLPVAVSATDPKLLYEGRFDLSASGGPRCNWAASAVHLKFRGSALNVRLSDSANTDRYEVVVDGKDGSPLKLKAGSHLYNVVSGAANEPHTVELMKRTESFFGTTQFEGFQLSAGGELLPSGFHPAHKLELIGDSMSCGYGNEAKDQTEHFNCETENAYMSYGAIAARALDADYTCIAWSGRLMWPKNTMDEIYDRVVATDPNSKWDFKNWTPDVVIINLGTNDYNQKDQPTAPAWTNGYEAFLARVRKNYPEAIIYCTSSPMLDGKKDESERALIHRIIKEENDRGDKNVRFMDFKTQNGRDGFGADWHPSIKTHQILAADIETTLSHDLGWKVVSQ